MEERSGGRKETDLGTVPFVLPLGEGGRRGMEGRGTGGGGETRGVVAEVGPQDGQGLHPPWGGGLLHGPAGHPGGRANLTSPRLAFPTRRSNRRRRWRRLGG